MTKTNCHNFVISCITGNFETNKASYFHDLKSILKSQGFKKFQPCWDRLSLYTIDNEKATAAREIDLVHAIDTAQRNIDDAIAKKVKEEELRQKRPLLYLNLELQLRKQLPFLLKL